MGLRTDVRSTLAAGVLLATIGCTIGAPTYTAVFPARGDPGSVSVDAEPVSLTDTTGLVVGIRVVPADPALDGAASIPGRPNALLVSWTGGACEAHVRLALTTSPAGFKVTIDADPSLGGMLGCPAVGIPRTIEIELSQPIEPSRVFVENLY